MQRFRTACFMLGVAVGQVAFKSSSVQVGILQQVGILLGVPRLATLGIATLSWVLAARAVSARAGVLESLAL